MLSVPFKENRDSTTEAISPSPAPISLSLSSGSQLPNSIYLSLPEASCSLICSRAGAWVRAGRGGAAARALGQSSIEYKQGPSLGHQARQAVGFSSSLNLQHAFGFSPRDTFISPAFTHQLFRQCLGERCEMVVQNEGGGSRRKSSVLGCEISPS